MARAAFGSVNAIFLGAPSGRLGVRMAATSAGGDEICGMNDDIGIILG
ncbi:MAG: hypothetical protein J1F13_05935 [Prevotellaceae bacterium]|nr:hypothetical protein [Prevotellaceae bacterium]